MNMDGSIDNLYLHEFENIKRRFVAKLYKSVDPIYYILTTAIYKLFLHRLCTH